MIKIVKNLVFLTLVWFLSSFTGTDYLKFIGTYGVSETDPSRIQLTLKADQTFYYQDFSVSSHKIVAQGSWTLKGNKVVLSDKNAGRRFHRVWTFDKEGKVARSRNGLTFYRLCKTGS